MKFKGVLLDIDNTLYDYSFAHQKALSTVFDNLSDLFSFERKTLEVAFAQARKKIHIELSQTAASHNRLLYFQRMFEYLNINPLNHTLCAYNTYWDTFLDNLNPYDGVYSFLKLIENKKVCLLSDLTAHIQHRKIQKLDLYNYIDALVTSEESGVEKPHPYIFMLALKKLDLIASDVCMVGDSFEKDIIGALGLGIRSFWLNWENEKKNLGKLATSVESFNDLIRIFR